jgi:hypothetical protein
VDAAFELQFVGVVPAAISNVGTGAADETVYVSDNGTLVRASDPTAGDEAVGTCDADGVCYLNFAVGGGGGSSPGAPNKSAQFNNGGTLGGMAGWTYESTGRQNATTSAFITYGATGDTYPVEGLVRVSSAGGSGTYKPLVSYLDASARDIQAITFFENGSGAPDILIGGRWDSLTGPWPATVGVWASSFNTRVNSIRWRPPASSSNIRVEDGLIYETTTATPAVAYTKTLSAATYELDITVVATSAGGESAVFKFAVAIDYSGAIIDAGDAAPYRVRKSAGATAWDCTLATGFSNVHITVTGEAGPVDWTIIATGVQSA